MESKANPNFWKSYDELPFHVRKLAKKNYRLWRANSYHPSLGFKKLYNLSGSEGVSVWRVEVGYVYRAVGIYNSQLDTITWFWIGTHEEYNKKQF